jgi:hypothetical protein
MSADPEREQRHGDRGQPPSDASSLRQQGQSLALQCPQKNSLSSRGIPWLSRRGWVFYFVPYVTFSFTHLYLHIPIRNAFKCIVPFSQIRQILPLLRIPLLSYATCNFVYLHKRFKGIYCMYLFYYPEESGSSFLKKFGTLLPNHTPLRLRRLYSVVSYLWCLPLRMQG